MTTITALDDDTVTVEAYNGSRYGGRQLTYLDATACPLDRAGTVAVIEALQSIVTAHDEAEAAKAAAKLKAGDKVTGHSRGFLFVVISDEADGSVDLVKLSTGEILWGRPVTAFRRQSGGAWVPRRRVPLDLATPF